MNRDVAVYEVVMRCWNGSYYVDEELTLDRFAELFTVELVRNCFGEVVSGRVVPAQNGSEAGK